MVAIFTGIGAGFVRGSANVLGGAGQWGSGALGRAGEQVSVNAATGNLLIAQQDEFLIGRGPDAGVSRTYNSLADAADGDNGDQWQQSSQKRIFDFNVGSNVKRQYADGSVVTYNWNGSNYITTDGDGAHDTLSYAGGIWTWTDGSSQVRELYSAYGSNNWRIYEQRDLEENVVSYSYSGDKLDKITTADGSWIQYSWSGNNITQVLARYTNLANGATVNQTRTRYTYDGYNRLSQVTVDLSPTDNSIGDGKTYVTTYTYYGSSKQVATISQSNGSYISISYDGAGRVTNLTQTAASGDTRVTALSYGANHTFITGPDGQVVRMDYDGAKQLTKITAPPATSGAAAQTVEYRYDGSGNVDYTQTYAGGTYVSNAWYRYDANGNLYDTYTTVSGEGYLVKRFTYGSRNEILTETSFTTLDVDGHGGADPVGAMTTRYAYDGYNRLRYAVTPEGGVTEYRYYGTGELAWIIEYPQHGYPIGSTAISEGAMDGWRNGLADRSTSKMMHYTYDARGNTYQSVRYGAAADGSPITSEGYTHSYFTYDHAGRLLGKLVAAEDNAWSNYVYDGLGRLVASTDNFGATTSFVFNDAATTTTVTSASGQVSVSTYNKAGELISQTTSGNYDPTATSTYKYDKLGRLRQSTNADGGNVYHLYDKAGRKTADINHYGWIVEYKYDGANRIVGEGRYFNGVSAAHLSALADPNNTLEIATIRPGGHYLDIWSWTVYDSAGRAIEKIDGSGGVSKFEYDGSNRLVKTTSYFNKLSQAQVDAFKTTPPTAMVLPGADGSKDRITRSFFDGDGQLIGALDGEGYLSEVVYDKAGQKVEEIAYAQKTNSAHWASGSFSTLRSTAAPTSAANIRNRYVYDSQGLLRYSIDANYNVTAYIYHEGTTWHAVGLVRSTVQYASPIASSTTNFTFNNIRSLVAPQAGAATNRQAWNVYNGSRLTYSIDAAGQVTGFVYNNVGQVIKTTQYSALRPTSSLPSDGDMAGWAASNSANARVTRNYYTAGGDLRYSVDAEGYVRRFDYDGSGRKVRDVIWANAISVSDATTINGVDSLTQSAGAWIDNNYSYYVDSDLLYSSWDAEGVRTIYSYFANGTLDAVYSAYGTVDQSLSLYRYDGAGRVTSEYHAYGDSEGTITHYGFDGLGNRTSMTDANGKVSYFAYDKLGQLVSTTDAVGGQTLYQYDAFRSQTAVRDARGYWTYNVYDNLGRLTQTTDASGVATTSTYTVFSELASVTRAGATTSFQYDKLGRVTRSTDALGHFETYGYDALGNRTSKTAKSANGSAVAGGTTTYAYDRRGLLISETLPMASYNNGGGLVSSTVTNTFTYDARGNRTQMVEAAGLAEARTTQYVYDKNNRLTRTIGQTFLGQTPSEYFYYDGRGNVTSTVNAAGGRTVFYYDDLGRKTVEISAAGTYTRYTYDQVGNVTAIRIYENVVGVPGDGGSEEEAPGAPGGNSRYTTFTYDNVNRMVTSSVHGAKTGVWNGSGWAADTSAIATTYQYDANDNVVKLTDAYGNATYSYYDALGRKTHQVDQENYLTAWVYNADGNVTSETRYANKVSGTPQVGTIPSVGASSDDRQTGFTYDLAGNRLSEARYYVSVHNGAGAHTTAHAVIWYSYNGLGQVVRKTEATGDLVDYGYDAAGRLTVESRTGYYDQAGAWVTPTVDYYYNGINNLSRTRARGSGDSAERVTMYGYDGDKLRWIADAEGNYRYYWYDQGGRQTYDYYTRLKSDGSADTSYNGNLTSYDVLGRVVSKWQADYTGNTWTTKGPVTQLTYNAFGDVIGTYVGGILQQQSQYDLAGRMVSTTSGDGLWKHFGYDKNGNQTVAITSARSDLGSSFDYALSVIGSTAVNASYTQYDKRNMATTVIEEQRQFSTSVGYQSLTTSRSYTAFGEVASETNALGYAINYTYNTMGRMIRSESPAVSIVHENGTAQTVRPTEDYYYDVSGRLVATRDANGSYSGQTKNANTGNLTILTLLAGTGYGGSQALATAESHADGGVKYTKYDIHGDARLFTDEIGRQSSRTYDRMGRVLTVSHAGGLVDNYRYDILGQQIKHWNNHNQTPVYGEPVWVEDGYWGGNPYEPEWIDTSYWHTPITGYTPDVETTDYDIQGRVISQRSFGGDITTTSYAWEGGLATAGIGTFGGWLQTTYMPSSLYSQERTDFFGRVTWKRDLGGYTTDYGYDVAGRMVSSASNGMLVSFGWYNSGQQYSVTIGSVNAGQVNTNWTRDVATYNYNVLGSRLTEYMYKEIGSYTPESWYWNPYDQAYEYTPESYYTYSQIIKNQSAGYDALGRMTSWAEAGTATSPASSTTTSYDAAGNVRRTYASYYMLDANGAASTSTARDYWFRYDSMNRVVTNQGILEGGQIVRGMGGYYGYATGQDIMYNAAGERTAVATTQAYYDGYGGYSANEVRENYFYDAAGRLASTYQAVGATAYTGQPIPAASGTGTLKSVFSYDLMGRMSGQTDYDTNGYTALYSRTAYYNTKGQLSSDYSWTKKNDNKTYSSSSSYYMTDYNSGQYMLGSVGWMQSTSSVSGTSGSTTSRTVNSYVWRDGAVQSHIQHKPNINQSTTYNTTFYLNALGQLTSVYIADGKPRSVSFTLDELGQIIRRDESGYISGQTGNPHEVWYRFSGRQLGYTGNNGTSEVSYDASLAERRLVQPNNPGTYRASQTYGTAYADFAQNYDPINSYFQGAAGGSYTVRQAETLQGIAQNLYGDSSLWYKIAEANGMSGAAALTEGQTLVLPSGVVRSKHNAGSFKPYDAGDAIGDLSPTTPTAPKPPKKPKCGTFGMILIAVIAIAVTVVTAGAAAAALAPAASAAAGGGILGGLSVIAGGTALAGGLSTGALIGIGAASAAAGSIVSQAVGVATGIQEKFSWKGVALAALGGAVSAGLAPGGVFGDAGMFGNIGSKVVQAGLRGAAGSAITQGIAVATGLQDKFSWAGVAAAGIGAAAGQAVSGLAGDAGHDIARGLGLKGGAYLRAAEGISRTLTGAASAIASAATRSAIEGTSFGPNLVAAIPDVIAGALQAAASACFTGETLIHTPTGMKRINEIRVGDLVYSRDESFVDERVQIKRVIQLYRFEERATLDVSIAFDASGEETVRATPEHPFAVIDEVNVTSAMREQGIGEPASRDHHVALLVRQPMSCSWQAAGDLRLGDRVIDINGRTGMVVAIEPVGLLSTVYNFAVEQHHTYFVGKSGTWVHNQYGAEVERLQEGLAVSPTELKELTQGELTALTNALRGLGEDIANSGDSNLISAYRETAQNVLFEQIGRAGGDPLRFMDDLRAGVAAGLYNFGEGVGNAIADVATSIWNNPAGAWDAAMAAGADFLGWLADGLDAAVGYVTGERSAVDDARAAAQYLIDSANVVMAGVMLDASDATASGGLNGLTRYIGEGLGYTIGSVVAGGVAGKVLQVGTRAVATRVAAGFNAARTVDRIAGLLGLGVNGTNAVRASVRNILSGNGRFKLKEALGLVTGARMARAQGFEYLGDLQYGSNNGIDGLLLNTRTGQYAFLETKGNQSGTLSLLDTDVAGRRQGSPAFNEDRLENYIRSNGPLRDHALAAQRQMQSGGTRSFASFRGSGTFYELLPTPGNPNGFTERLLYRRGRR